MVLNGSEFGTELLFRCAETLSREFHAPLQCLCYGAGLHTFIPPDIQFIHIDSANSLPEAVKAVGETSQIKMLVSDWPQQSECLSCVLSALQQNNLPGILVRKGRHCASVRNALILASGGPHIVHHLWSADAISEELGLPPRILCVELPEAKKWGCQEQESSPAGLNAARLVGLKAPLKVSRCEDFVQGITQNVKGDDMVILGGPTYARVGEFFEGSIPDILSKKLPNDLIMFLGRKPSVFDISDIFWEEVVYMDMPRVEKNKAIELLIDKLVKNKQIPAAGRRYVLESAMRRETLYPTATDAETAFPHVTIPGISGLIGSLGICPEGIDFGGGPEQLSKFIFLLISPREHYDEYLGLLSEIANIMLSPRRRADILQSTSPREVLGKLENYRPDHSTNA